MELLTHMDLVPLILLLQLLALAQGQQYRTLLMTRPFLSFPEVWQEGLGAQHSSSYSKNRLAIGP